MIPRENRPHHQRFWTFPLVDLCLQNGDIHHGSQGKLIPPPKFQKWPLADLWPQIMSNPNTKLCFKLSFWASGNIFLSLSFRIPLKVPRLFHLSKSQMLTRRILRTIDLSPTWVLFPKSPRESLLRNFKHILKRTASRKYKQSAYRRCHKHWNGRLCYVWKMTFSVPQIVARNACLMYFWIFQAHIDVIDQWIFLEWLPD